MAREKLEVEQVMEKYRAGQRELPEIELPEGADLRPYIQEINNLYNPTNPLVLYNSKLIGLIAPEIVIPYANLNSADLYYANLNSADLRSANLRSADLRSADLTSAKLIAANLEMANLGSAKLRGADLYHANLNFANLNFANLNFANLNSAKLYYTSLYSAYLKEITFNWNGSCHSLVSEYLRQKAGKDIKKQMLAAFVGADSSKCFDYFVTLDAKKIGFKKEKEWALLTLAQAVKQGDNAPEILLQYRK